MKLGAIDNKGERLKDDFVSENLCSDLAELLELYGVETITGASQDLGDDYVITIRFSDGSTRDIVQIGGLN